MTVLVRNPTTGTLSGPVGLSLFVSPVPSLDGATEVGQTVTKKLNLKAGKAKAVQLKLTSVPSVPDGNYYLIALVTGADNKPTGVAAAAPVRIAAPFVTTKVSGVAPSPASAPAGKAAGLKLTLTNSGNVAAAGTAAVGVTLSTSPTDAGGQVVSPAPAPLKVRLNPGKAKTLRVRFTVPAGLAAGTYYLSVSVDVASLGDKAAVDGIAVSTTTLTVK